jgi:hypothetical protein
LRSRSNLSRAACKGAALPRFGWEGFFITVPSMLVRLILSREAVLRLGDEAAKAGGPADLVSSFRAC